jgi:polyhydroxybutyrate depolymerase
MAMSFVTSAAAQQPQRLHWKVDGVEREALVFAPVAAASAPAPLILAFHGHGGNMRGFANLTQFPAAWPDAVVVYLQGLPTESNRDPAGKKPGWESGPDALDEHPNPDVDFVDSVLATMHRRFNVDDRRVYATGFSNGAFMTLMLWTIRGGTFAAFAPVAGGIRGWNPPSARPVFYIGGARDPLVKPDTQRTTIAKIRSIDGANGPGAACGTGCTFYASTSGTPVRVMSHPGGHLFPPFATAAIVAFFKNHQLRK